MYADGLLSYGDNLAQIPIIDTRTDDQTDLHRNVYRNIVRARIDRAAGSHANQVFWFEPLELPSGMPTPLMTDKTFDVMDQWLSAIETDKSAKSHYSKVIADKPAAAKDGCFLSEVAVPQTLCNAVTAKQTLARMVAGMPMTADVLKCSLKPLSRARHAAEGIVFTNAQWAAMQTTFPQGVCDYSKPGVGQTPPIGSWLSYSSGAGKLLPPPPSSITLS